MFFLTPRKCALFGVQCKAFPRQVNFLLDESGDCGKGANTVISLLHYYFDHHGLGKSKCAVDDCSIFSLQYKLTVHVTCNAGEKKVFLHADNCVGQNKNNYVLWYLMWRVLTGRHSEVTLSFLVVGHTKFAPDWCFGLFKQLYRKTNVGSLKAIADVCDKSGR